jgi:membrane peptidoglycan carboxypeptidase
LELYLNIIELGPKIYGIRDASSHYFARSPSQLTLLQSLWLASIIPNPRAFYHHFRKGAVSDEWRTYLTWIAGKMFERGAVSAEEFARLAATGFAVHFGAGPDGSEPVDVPSLGHEVPQGEGEPASPGTAPSVDPDQQP